VWRGVVWRDAVWRDAVWRVVRCGVWRGVSAMRRGLDSTRFAWRRLIDASP